MPGCDQAHEARGWCRVHYTRWVTHGDPIHLATPTPPACQVSGCDAPHYGRGFCQGLYRRWRDHGDPHAPAADRRTAPANVLCTLECVSSSDLAPLVCTDFFFSLMCPSDHVYAFEPRRRFLAILDTNVGLNDGGDKVTTCGFALSDEDGEVTVTLDGSDHVLVTRRLDDLVDRPVALIKVDVEGMEPRVLDGAARILRQDGPVVYAEALTDGEFAALRDTLARHRYEPTGRRFNASPTYEFVPDAARRSSLGWTGPVPVQPPAPPTAQRPVTARRPWPVRARMWVRRQPVVRRIARWRNSLRGR